ncbi:uncharacterized protein LOC129808437 [Phlebotomus papatasi]|uniref:uncharacterized protein LOC129808437 n=1 Tax=Phlebotomus papatasi TaxID=29031 RepID=UPI002483BE77|nr:uncharacterized protein LOC129808437 [Phlebotomus papatasi]
MTSYLQFISDNFGHNISQDMKTYMREQRKYARATSRKQFLLKCRSSGITPSHIINNVKCLYQTISKESPYNKDIDNMIKSFQHRILSMEIKVTYWEVNRTHKKLTELLHKLRSTGIPSMSSFLTVQEQVFWREFQRSTSVHSHKYNALFTKQLGNVINMPASDWVVNTTNVSLPQELKLLMGLSPRFSLPYKNLPPKIVLHLLAEIEDVIRAMSDDDTTTHKNTIRSRVAHIINSHLTHHRTNAREKYFLNLETVTRRFIREHSEIIIVSSDKGNKTVVMWRDEYEEKMTNIVSDETTYKKTTANQLNIAERKNNTLVKRLYEGGHIDFITKRELTTHNSRTPRIYGLPKIHKTNTPLRPIVSCIKSPTYALSKFLNQLLKPISNVGGYNVKDSFEFVERVTSCEVPEGHIMISLDVVSLFPNIPRDLALQIVEECWDAGRITTTIDKKLFLEILKFCLETSFFTFGDQHYSQMDGMPMGGPLSPIIADIVMDYAISKILENIPNRVICLTKYVDDIFCLVPRDKVTDILSTFNGFHPKLQFTVEMEKEGGLPYLDTFVIRKPTNLVTMWYKKPIASDRMLNFHSQHPLRQKTSSSRSSE